ncbi:MAG: phosphoribosylanthranilate isomerase [Phycisphaerae bacterium]|nr:phosphoribosylanthranilate isomerase [Phycisphaerae bacterium]
MRTRVKICGLSTLDAVSAAIDAGADAVGFVFAPSPRRIDAEQARGLAAGVPAFVMRVGVWRELAEEQAGMALLGVPLDLLQAEARSLASLPGMLRSRCLPTFNDGPGLQTELDAYLGPRPAGRCPPVLLVDGARSGGGVAADWERVTRAVGGRARVVLAGGLNADNVAEAIARVRPWAVDVSGGVESAPGVKDPAMIHAFVAAVRKADMTYGTKP